MRDENVNFQKMWISKHFVCLLIQKKKNRKTNHFEHRSPGQRRRSKNAFSSYPGPVRTPAQKTHSHLCLQSSPFSILPLCLWAHFCSCVDKQIKSLTHLLNGLPITVFPGALSSQGISQKHHQINVRGRMLLLLFHHSVVSDSLRPHGL